MKKQVYYHGTSADNLQSILKHGLMPDTEKLWGCSRQEVYLWGAQELAKAEDREDDLDEWKEGVARDMAIESGRIACAVAKDCRIVVVKCMLNPKKLEEDTSCDIMSGAMCIEKVAPAQIIGIEISNNIAMLKGIIIAGLLDMWQWGRVWSDTEIKIAKKMKEIEWYPEDYEDIMEWEIVKSGREIVSCNL